MNKTQRTVMHTASAENSASATTASQPTHPKARRALTLLLVGAALSCLCLLALGCSSGSSGSSASADGSAQDSVESTALVVYANGNDILLVDQTTNSPFFPTIPAQGIEGLDGQTISADDLQVGNVLALVGNGIMLESFPGQYPGITEMRILETGSPEAAEQYADLVASVFPPVDPTSEPVGSLAYTNASGQITLSLNPYRFRVFASADGTDSLTLDGAFYDENGLVAPGINDARITGPTPATVTFDRAFQSMEVARYPLASETTDTARVELTTPQEPVRFTSEQTGTADFTMEPGYVYTFAVTFAECEANFAVIVTA